MQEYLRIFIDDEYPAFLDKYLNTKTLNRIKYVTQFCGCDYTTLYSPLFMYTRFDHSLVVAHMTWHFTHDKKSTIVALLHDVGTPCFAHTIDYVFGDYIKQESSEKSIVDIIQQDTELTSMLQSDGISFKDLQDLSKYPILENKSPKLCTDRLDGVLHTCYVWLHTHPLISIKEVYDDMIVLTNEEGLPEIGFKNKSFAEKFCAMVYVYAKELQGNTDKFVMKYVSEIVKCAFKENIITLDDLYTKKESEIVDIFKSHYDSWQVFAEAQTIISTDEEPAGFYTSINSKKRNTIPLVQTDNDSARINLVSDYAKEIYQAIENYHDHLYAYIDGIKRIRQ